MKLAVALILASVLPAQHEIGKMQPPLDKTDSRRLLRDAEKQLAILRKRTPPRMTVRTITEVVREWNRDGSGDWVQREIIVERETPIKVEDWKPKWTEHAGNPLIGRTCSFDVTFDFVLSEEEAARRGLLSRAKGKPPRASDNEPAREPRMLICGTVRANIGKHFDLKDVYPGISEQIENFKKKEESYEKRIKDQKKKLKRARTPRAAEAIEEGIDRTKDNIKELKKHVGEMRADFKKETRAVKHRVLVRLPQGYAPPSEIPRRFEVAMLIARTDWDENAPLPFYLIHGDLVRSDDLGLSAVGIIDGS